MYIRLLYYGYSVFLFFMRPVTLGVRVMLVQQGRVLLVRHTYLRGWYLPGGGLKRGETIEAAARREVREEAGAELGEISLMGVYSNLDSMKTDHNVLFLCTDFALTGGHDAEIAETQFFPLTALPEGTRAGHRRRIEEYAGGRSPLPFGSW